MYVKGKSKRPQVVLNGSTLIDMFNNIKCNYVHKSCSILNKAIEGRIQEEISCGTCSKYKLIKK